MADAKNEYHLYVHADNVGEKKKVVAGAKNENKTSEAKSYGEKTADSAAKAIKGMVSYASVKSFADNLVSYEISQVNLRTGAAEYEQKLEFAQTAVNRFRDTAVSVGIGLATGNAPLAILGAATSLFNTLIGYAQRANTIRTQQNLEDVSIGMASQRAGVSGRRGANQ